MFKLQTGVQRHARSLPAVPQAIGDLLNGTNQYHVHHHACRWSISSPPASCAHLRSPGRNGLPALKDVPTIVEARLPGSRGRGLGRLGGEDRDAERRRRAPECGHQQGARDSRRFVMPLLEDGAQNPAGGTPAEFGNLITSQVAYWGKVVKDVRHQDAAMTMTERFQGDAARDRRADPEPGAVRPEHADRGRRPEASDRRRPRRDHPPLPAQRADRAASTRCCSRTTTRTTRRGIPDCVAHRLARRRISAPARRRSASSARPARVTPDGEPRAAPMRPTSRFASPDEKLPLEGIAIDVDRISTATASSTRRTASRSSPSRSTMAT